MGVLIASAILISWSALQVWLLLVPLDAWAWGWGPFAIALHTWLFTGLFITAHDAMHGTVAPGHPRLNAVFGRIATALYASFSYDALLRAHHRHHAHPGSDADPDYHADERGGVIAWYAGFMRESLNLTQLALQGLIFVALVYGLGLAALNVLLFWALPALASTAQLFFVGTYLPHRPGEDFADGHRARSLDMPAWMSLLACYHFGYHLEHHRQPQVPWWGLPRARRAVAQVVAEDHL